MCRVVIHVGQWNREALWTSNYTNTTTYQFMTKLNTVGLFVYYIHSNV